MIKLLDCTLRDGGQGLEDAYINNIPMRFFEESEVEKILGKFAQTSIEIIELGSLDFIENSKKEFCVFNSLDEISKMKRFCSSSQMCVALFKGPDFELEDIPTHSDSTVDGVRVIIRYSELKKSINFCKGLCEKGYKVFVQPMLTARYTEDELDYILESANEMGAYAVYFVDSYGYLDDYDVKRFFDKYNEKLNNNIAIGFHAHNNMDMAVSNAITFVKNCEMERDIIVDACALGIGQGAGNLETEVIANYLNRRYKKSYDLKKIIEICELIERHNINSLWGYSLTKFIPARNRAAYKYAVALKNNYNYTYSSIDSILSSIPEELRHRYTKSNLKRIVDGE